MRFELSDDELQEIQAWKKEQDSLAVEQQKKMKFKNDSDRRAFENSWKQGLPYGGAVGGSMTYMFTPTSIGMVTEVEHAVTKNRVDVTSYDNW